VSEKKETYNKSFSVNRDTINRRIYTGFSQSSNSSEASKLFPTVKLGGDKLVEVIRQFKNNLNLKRISFVSAFKILDLNNTGLVSFGTF